MKYFFFFLCILPVLPQHLCFPASATKAMAPPRPLKELILARLHSLSSVHTCAYNPPMQCLGFPSFGKDGG